MASPRPALIIRLTHTGQYSDGRANQSPVLVPDLDVGYEHQDRKVPVYVPQGGHIDIYASSRSILSFEQGGIRKFTNAGVLRSRMFYVPESFQTSDLPPAADYPPGTHIWNTTDNQVYWSNGIGWIAGNEPTGPAGGDLNGAYPNPTVIGIQGHPVQNGVEPANGDVLVYNLATHQWEHTSLTFGGGPPVGPAGGSLAGLYPNPTLTLLGTSGSYGDAANVPVITTTSEGRVSGASTPIQIAETQHQSHDGPNIKALRTTSVFAGAGLTGGAIFRRTYFVDAKCWGSWNLWGCRKCSSLDDRRPGTSLRCRSYGHSNHRKPSYRLNR